MNESMPVNENEEKQKHLTDIFYVYNKSSSAQRLAFYGKNQRNECKDDKRSMAGK